MRRRVSDHTVFSLCVREMNSISNEINLLIKEMVFVVKNKKDTIDTLPLAEKIELFESIYNNVLRITAREPLAFLLFIAGLKAFRNKIDQF